MADPVAQVAYGNVDFALHLDAITYSTGPSPLLGPITCQIGRGERVIVLGPNGAGKSLLLRLAHRLIAPVAGRIVRSACGPLREAMVFQRPVLLRRSVLGNVLFGLRSPGVSHTDALARATAALKLVGLEPLADRPARVLSGGEQQRVALARAAIIEPDLLWLDEPTSSLDPGATRMVEDAALAMNQRGTTLVMATHDIGQARRLATRVLFLHKGQLLEDSPAQTFFSGGQHALGRRFLAGELLA